jgi:hypothetical protein
MRRSSIVVTSEHLVGETSWQVAITDNAFSPLVLRMWHSGAVRS